MQIIFRRPWPSVKHLRLAAEAGDGIDTILARIAEIDGSPVEQFGLERQNLVGLAAGVRAHAAAAAASAAAAAAAEAAARKQCRCVRPLALGSSTRFSAGAASI